MLINTQPTEDLKVLSVAIYFTEILYSAKTAHFLSTFIVLIMSILMEPLFMYLKFHAAFVKKRSPKTANYLLNLSSATLPSEWKVDLVVIFKQNLK